MKKEFTIDVTQERIDAANAERAGKTGVPRILCDCPIELAAKAALDGVAYDFIAVTQEYIRVRLMDGTNLYGALPDEAQTFVRRYDDCNFVAPFSFPLTLDLTEASR